MTRSEHFIEINTLVGIREKVVANVQKFGDERGDRLKKSGPWKSVINDIDIMIDDAVQDAVMDGYSPRYSTTAQVYLL